MYSRQAWESLNEKFKLSFYDHTACWKCKCSIAERQAITEVNFCVLSEGAPLGVRFDRVAFYG